MNNVFASIQTGEAVGDGAGSIGTKFDGIWVGGDGDIAISYDAGKTFIVYSGAVGGGVAALAGNYIGTAAQGTTATGLVLGRWGPV